MYLSYGFFLQWKIVLMFLFESNVYCPSGTSLLKAEFLVGLKRINFCGVLSCVFFFFSFFFFLVLFVFVLFCFFRVLFFFFFFWCGN